MLDVNEHGTQDTLGPLEILIVSEDPSIDGPILDAIKRQGIAVTVLRDGRLLPQKSSSATPDLILLDFGLSATDGIAVCKQLKACDDTRDLPVVLMLASDELDKRGEGLRAGAADYLIKPLLLEEVMPKLRLHTRRRALPPQAASPRRHGKRGRQNRDDAEYLYRELSCEACTELPLQKRYFREIFHNLSDSIYLVEVTEDERFRYLEANRTFEQRAGVAADGLQGKYVGDLLRSSEDEVTVEKAIAKFRQCLETGSVLDEEVTLDLQSGRRICRSTLTPLFDDSGRIDRILAISRDITESKRMESKVQSHLHFFESMDRVNRAIQKSNDLETVLNDVLDTLLPIFDCDRAFLIYSCDPEADSWHVPFEKTKLEYPGALALNLVMPMDADVATTFRILLDADGPVTYGAGNQYPLPKEVSEQFAFKALMSMAVYPKGDKPWQFGIHQCSRNRIWTADEIKLFQEIGRRLADGLSSLLAYRALQVSEREYRTLAENAPFGIARYDAQGRITYLNFGVEKAINKTIAEVRGRRPTECLPPHLYADYEKYLLQVTTNGKETEFDLIFPIDGDLEICRIAMVAERDAAGNISGVLAIGRDITQQRRAEDSLRRSEALYRSMVLAMVEGVIVQSRDGEILSINPSAEKILRLSAEQILGKNLLDAGQQILSSDGKPFPEDQHPAILSLRTGQPQFDVQLGWAWADGEVVWILINSQPLFMEGNDEPYAVISTFHDITERKRIENTLKFIAQSGWQESGESFLVSLVHFIAEMLQVDYVLIDKLAADPAYTETVLVYAKGEILPNMQYGLAGTPCDNVMEGSLCCYPEKVQQLFPEDTLLVDMQVASYAGLPLKDAAGNTIGLIAVMDGKPMKDKNRVVSILQLVAIRVAAELERNRFDRALAKSRQFLRRVIDAIAEPVFVKDRLHRWILLNEAFSKIIGYPTEVLLGKSDYDFFPREEADEFWRRDEAVFDTGDEDVSEENFTDRNGITHTIITKKTRHQDDSGEMILVGIILDITERKQMEATIRKREEEFRTLAENLPDVIVRYDTSFRRTYINKVYRKMLEPLGVDLLGKTPLEFWKVSQPNAEEFTQMLQQIVDTGNPETTLIQAETRAGRMIYWAMNLVPEFDQAGKINGVLSCANDITELKEYQRELEKSRLQLRALASRSEKLREDERKHIARELHDDLGQRLTALNLDLSRLMLRFGQRAPGLQQQVEEMEADMRATIQIVRNVATQLRPSALEMGIVSALEWLILEFRKRSNVECRLRIPQRNMALNDSQATAIFRIVQESLTNIMRYAMASKVEIVLLCDVQHYVLEINDDGIGFNANEKRKTDSFGLIGIEERALSLGGDMCIETAQDKGLKLTIRIPVFHTKEEE